MWTKGVTCPGTKIIHKKGKMSPLTLLSVRNLVYKGHPVKEIIYTSKIDNEVFAYAHIAYYTDQDFLTVFKNKSIYILFAVKIVF